MATSGSSDFNVTRDQIIADAALHLVAIRVGETPSAAMIQDFARALNAMVKAWAANGIHVWTIEEATLFLQKSQVRYAISNASSSDHVTASFVETAMTAAAASGATTIPVVSTAGMSGGDTFGVELDDGSMHWTTTPGGGSATTIVLTAGLGSAAAAGNRVLAYTSRIVRPLKIVNARRHHFVDSRDTEFDLISRLDYQRLANKTQSGTVNQGFYDPRGGANSAGLFYVYNSPADVEDCIKFTWHRPIEDFDAAGDNPDLPQEWIETLGFNLALRKAAGFEVPRDRYDMIKEMATYTLDLVSGFDRENESVDFAPDMGP